MRLRSAVVLAGTAGVAGALLEPLFPVVRRAVVPVLPAGWDAVRVLHLSDLHLLPRQRAKRAWVRSLASLDPDLVITTGDNIAAPDAVPALLDALTLRQHFGSLEGRTIALIFDIVRLSAIDSPSASPSSLRSSETIPAPCLQRSLGEAAPW